MDKVDIIHEERLKNLCHAICEDMEDSLKDPDNKFTEASKNDPCCCYGNMQVMKRLIRNKPQDYKHYIRLIKYHVDEKICSHTWHYKKYIVALRELNKPIEF
jgi:hypothetical protein